MFSKELVFFTEHFLFESEATEAMDMENGPLVPTDSKV